MMIDDIGFYTFFSFVHVYQLQHGSRYMSNISQVSHFLPTYFRSLQASGITTKYERRQKYCPFCSRKTYGDQLIANMQNIYCTLIHHLSRETKNSRTKFYFEFIIKLVKVRLSPSKKVGFICFNETPLWKCFSFHLKSSLLFFLKIFKFLS